MQKNISQPAEQSTLSSIPAVPSVTDCIEKPPPGDGPELELGEIVLMRLEVDRARCSPSAARNPIVQAVPVHSTIG
jgi:hypothetical protein